MTSWKEAFQASGLQVPLGPHFKQYAQSNGRTPAEQLAHDTANFTSAETGFSLWLQRRHLEAIHEIGYAFVNGEVVDQPAFDRWLRQWVANVLAEPGK